eukprot:TRINITY_DN1300_c4_g2_i1.p1 TRINITY_DN1300_c4_g2~~TRINITY_DN1300_c4_g2_i1.p1  ORF type:complete len:492 (+),score=85.33 TRINITY_DN1300_c4_g2_i1:74-1549(+)
MEEKKGVKKKKKMSPISRRLIKATAGLAVAGTAYYRDGWRETANQPHTTTDVTVIGGGVVGLSIARELAIRGVDVQILEKANEIATAASGGNSGLGCTGYDSNHDTLEFRLLRSAIKTHPNLYRKLGLSYTHVNKCGALMVAWDESDLATLPEMIDKMHTAGDTEACILTKEDLLELEPHLAPSAKSAVSVQRENVVEPWVVTIAHANSAILNGVRIVKNAHVTGIKPVGKTGLTEIETENSGVFRTRTVINCAGLYGDEIHALATNTGPSFKITPRKGEFAVLHVPNEDPSDPVLQKIIQSAPRKDVGKGVQIWRNLHGGYVVGPTADDQTGPNAKTDRSTDPNRIEKLVETAKQRVPGLKDAVLVGTYSGLRPSIKDRSDYIIEKVNDGYITVSGIRSTGLTAAPAIGEYTANLYQGVSQGVDGGLVLPPYTPSHPVADFVPNPSAPSIEELAVSYCMNKNGTVEAFGRTWIVGHGMTKVELDYKCKNL